MEAARGLGLGPASAEHPDQAVSLMPHRGNPELETMRKAVFTALEIRDEAEQPQLSARWSQQFAAVAEASKCADTSEHQATSHAEEPRASQHIADMNSPSTPTPKPQTSPESEPE